MEGVYELVLNVNGKERYLHCRSTSTLLGLLRGQLYLTSVKPGCMNGDCGSCTVLINDLPVKSCLTLALKTQNQKVETLESKNMDAVQKAFIRHNAFQCGYCTPGFIMNVAGLLRNEPEADERTVKEWLQSNICRCTSYEEIKAAVEDILTRKG